MYRRSILFRMRLDPDWYRGALYELMMTLDSLPEALGGAPKDKRDAVLKAEPFAGHYFGGDGRQAHVIDYRSSSLCSRYLRQAHALTAIIAASHRRDSTQGARATAAPQKSRNNRLI